MSNLNGTMKNFTNRSIDNFNYIGKINIKELKENIMAISDSEWEDFDWRQKTFNVHKTTQTIPLIYDKDFRENDLTYWKHYNITKTFLNELENKFKKAISDGFIVRAILVKLKANTSILPHTDNLTTLDKNNRFHIPVITNKKVLFTVGDEVKNLKEGEVWEINNGKKLHSVTNNSDKDRVHIIVDWIKYD